MKLRVRAFGLAVGVVCGLGIFAVTLIDAARGAGKTLKLIDAFFWGYTVSVSGAFIGFFWAFICGFICAALIAWLYNILHKAIYKA
jgi:hypothetical protein